MTTINVGLLKSNIEELVNQRGESKTKVFINSGVGKDFFSNLNKGQIPSVEKIISLAEYLGVSVDYLLGRTQEPTKMSGNQIKTGNITGDSNANMNMDTNKIPKYDKTTMQVADIFQDLDVFDKAKVLNLITELSEKKGA